MAENERPNLADVHRLGVESKEWQKRVVMKKVSGRWFVKIDRAEGSTILTPRDVKQLSRALIVERRKQERKYRQQLRGEKRKNESNQPVGV